MQKFWTYCWEYFAYVPSVSCLCNNPFSCIHRNNSVDVFPYNYMRNISMIAYMPYHIKNLNP